LLISWEDDFEDVELLLLLLLLVVEREAEPESDEVEDVSREQPAAKTIIAASRTAAAFLKLNNFITFKTPFCCFFSPLLLKIKYLKDCPFLKI